MLISSLIPLTSTLMILRIASSNHYVKEARLISIGSLKRYNETVKQIISAYELTP